MNETTINIESLTNVAFIAGVIAIFQWSSEVIFNVGQILMILAVLGIVGAMLIHRTHWQPFLERLTVIGMITGIISMFQPWVIRYYELGFLMLAISTLSFIIVSHFPAPEEN